MAPRLSDRHIDAMLNEADKLDLVNWDRLSDYLARAGTRRMPGAARLATIIQDRLIVLTDSELERMFIRISRKAALRFTHAQIAKRPDYVARTLAGVAKRNTPQPQ